MKVIKGHLTATNKKHIKAIMDQGLMRGKIGRISYSLTVDGCIYTVKIKQKDRGLGFVGSDLRESTYTHKFMLI